MKTLFVPGPGLHALVGLLACGLDLGCGGGGGKPDGGIADAGGVADAGSPAADAVASGPDTAADAGPNDTTEAIDAGTDALPHRMKITSILPQPRRIQLLPAGFAGSATDQPWGLTTSAMIGLFFGTSGPLNYPAPDFNADGGLGFRYLVDGVVRDEVWRYSRTYGLHRARHMADKTWQYSGFGTDSTVGAAYHDAEVVPVASGNPGVLLTRRNAIKLASYDAGAKDYAIGIVLNETELPNVDVNEEFLTAAIAKIGGDLLAIRGKPAGGGERLYLKTGSAVTEVPSPLLGSKSIALRCLDGICVVTHTGSTFATVFAWTGTGMPTGFSQVTIGNEPYGVDLKKSATGVLCAVTASADEKIILFDVAAGGVTGAPKTIDVPDCSGAMWPLHMPAGDEVAVTCLRNALGVPPGNVQILPLP